MTTLLPTSCNQPAINTSPSTPTSRPPCPPCRRRQLHYHRPRHRHQGRRPQLLPPAIIAKRPIQHAHTFPILLPSLEQQTQPPSILPAPRRDITITIPRHISPIPTLQHTPQARQGKARQYSQSLIQTLKLDRPPPARPPHVAVLDRGAARFVKLVVVLAVVGAKVVAEHHGAEDGGVVVEGGRLAAEVAHLPGGEGGVAACGHGGRGGGCEQSGEDGGEGEMHLGLWCGLVGWGLGGAVNCSEILRLGEEEQWGRSAQSFSLFTLSWARHSHGVQQTSRFNTEPTVAQLRVGKGCRHFSLCLSAGRDLAARSPSLIPEVEFRVVARYRLCHRLKILSCFPLPEPI